MIDICSVAEHKCKSCNHHSFYEAFRLPPVSRGMPVRLQHLQPAARVLSGLGAVLQHSRTPSLRVAGFEDENGDENEAACERPCTAKDSGDRDPEQRRAEEVVSKAGMELAQVMTVDELVASIAHEISQPLAAIVSNADAGLRWLSRDEPNLQETGQAIRRIIRDGKRASAMISRMRALFKKTPTETEPLDLNEVIQEVVAMVYCEAEKNRILLRTDLAGDLPRVTGDRIQLQQVILNLLVNAIQALSGMRNGKRELYISSHKGSQICAERGGDQGISKPEEVVIEVSDSGPGIDSEHLNQLFEAFYTTKPDGLGIGLTISRAIVKAHGGRFWATSNELCGAAFQFSLPVGS